MRSEETPWKQFPRDPACQHSCLELQSCTQIHKSININMQSQNTKSSNAHFSFSFSMINLHQLLISDKCVLKIKMFLPRNHVQKNGLAEVRPLRLSHNSIGRYSITLEACSLQSCNLHPNSTVPRLPTQLLQLQLLQTVHGSPTSHKWLPRTPNGSRKHSPRQRHQSVKTLASLHFTSCLSSRIYRRWSQNIHDSPEAVWKSWNPMRPFLLWPISVWNEQQTSIFVTCTTHCTGLTSSESSSQNRNLFHTRSRFHSQHEIFHCRATSGRAVHASFFSADSRCRGRRVTLWSPDRWEICAFHRKWNH